MLVPRTFIDTFSFRTKTESEERFSAEGYVGTKEDEEQKRMGKVHTKPTVILNMESVYK